MAFDINLISKFNLMDYSLLFVVVYNERYVEKYPEQFEHDEYTNKLKKPITEKKSSIITKKLWNEEQNDQGINEFFTKMSSDEEFSLFDEYILNQSQLSGLGKKLEKDSEEYHEMLGDQKP